MAETITMPKLGFDMVEGTLVRWLKKEGQEVKKGEVIAEIETDKATVEVEAVLSGYLRRLLADQGTIIPVNQPIAIIGTIDEDISVDLENATIPLSMESHNEITSSQSIENKELSTEDERQSKSERIIISPLARRLAIENGIKIEEVIGTGPSGRIVKRDIEKYLTSEPAHNLSDSTVSIVPLNKLRKIISKRMVESKSKIPHFYISRSYKVDRLMDLRKQFNDLIIGKGKISVNDLIVKAASLSLRDFSNLYASYSEGTIIYHSSINIGIAVSIEDGLITVVCKDADKKSLFEISRETRAMAERARSGKVKPGDIEGSNFSISNLGMFEVDNFSAIINPPEAAILALGTSKEVPVVENGSISVGQIMNATISVDHRVSDGVESARFMQRLGEFLESPLSLFVEESF